MSFVTQYIRVVNMDTKVDSRVINAETMLSINEAIDDMKKPHLKSASSYDELEKLLDE